MNQRIRELWDKAAQEAAAYPSGQNNSWETQVKFMEKFAELIVRECGKVAFDDWCEGTNESSSQIAILKHFNVGVEE